MPPSSDRTPEYWRAHAEKARARAEGMTDPEGTRIMLQVATLYEEMAGRAEREARYASTIGHSGMPTVHDQQQKTRPDEEPKE